VNSVLDSPWFIAIMGDFPLLIFSSAFASALVLIPVAFFLTKEEIKKLGILIVGLAVLGSVAGIAGGISRVGVVGDIIPAALGLVAGVSFYLFGVDQSKGIVASLCATAFALALGFGYAAGAGNRDIRDRFDRNLAFCSDGFSNPEILNNDRAFMRFSDLFGTTCIQMIATDRAMIPEKAISVEDKFRQIKGSMTKELDALKSGL